MAEGADFEHEVARLMIGKPGCTRADICLGDKMDWRGRKMMAQVQGNEGNFPLPKLKHNICYVVTAVVFNEQGQLLMTREGFHPCYGRWYLPAGRVDPEETLAEAVTREVREETGLQFDPTTLLIVQNPATHWFRFTFTGKITGGKLLTQAEASDETLEAGWFDISTVMNAAANHHLDQNPLKTFTLRGDDIIELVKIGQEFFKHQKDKMEVLPSLVELDRMFLRPVLVCEDSEGLSVLSYSEEGKGHHVPVLDITATSNTAAEVLLEPNGTVSIYGVLALEHDGRKKMDGLCLTILASVKKQQDFPLASTKGFSWTKITKANLKKLYQTRLTEGGSIKFSYQRIFSI